MGKLYCTYILANKPRGTIYIGTTGDIARRIEQHKSGAVEGFTKKYKLYMFVYCEMHDNPYGAIKREKQLKNWHRDWKIALIEKENPEWKDLSDVF